MKYVLAGLVILAVSAGPAAAAGSGAPNLSWMSGCWEQRDDDMWVEECWTIPRAGMMMGSGRTGKGGAVNSFEFMRIAPGGGDLLVFWASPGGKAAVPFALVKSQEREVIFENTEHDFPQRVRYWRDGDNLRAEISDRLGKQKTGWKFKRMQ